MFDLDKTRIPDVDKIQFAGKKRELLTDFLPVIYRLTDISIHLSSLEVRNDRDTFRDFRFGLFRTRDDLNTWNDKINEIKKSAWGRIWRQTRFHPQLSNYVWYNVISRKPEDLPKIPLNDKSDFTGQRRELLADWMQLIEHFRSMIDPLVILETKDHRVSMIEFKEALRKAFAYVYAWNNRIIQIKVHVWNETSRKKKFQRHTYNVKGYGIQKYRDEE